MPRSGVQVKAVLVQMSFQTRPYSMISPLNKTLKVGGPAGANGQTKTANYLQYYSILLQDRVVEMSRRMASGTC